MEAVGAVTWVIRIVGRPGTIGIASRPDDVLGMSENTDRYPNTIGTVYGNIVIS